MKVFVVYAPCGQGEITKAVFSSMELAQNAVSELRSNSGGRPYYIDEYELDKFSAREE